MTIPVVLSFPDLPSYLFPQSRHLTCVKIFGPRMPPYQVKRIFSPAELRHFGHGAYVFCISDWRRSWFFNFRCSRAGFLFLQKITNLVCPGRINSGIALFHMLDDAVLV